MPLETLNAFRAIVEGRSEQWEIIGWTESAKTIVRNVLNSNKEATDLSNALGSRAYFQFLDGQRLPGSNDRDREEQS